jgi:hypothetical protein
MDVSRFEIVGLVTCPFGTVHPQGASGKGANRRRQLCDGGRCLLRAHALLYIFDI